jgi:hypothetical protein
VNGSANSASGGERAGSLGAGGCGEADSMASTEDVGGAHCVVSVGEGEEERGANARPFLFVIERSWRLSRQAGLMGAVPAVRLVA